MKIDKTANEGAISNFFYCKVDIYFSTAQFKCHYINKNDNIFLCLLFFVARLPSCVRYFYVFLFPK